MADGRSLLARLGTLGVVIVVTASLLAAAEGAVRLFTDTQVLGESSNLFVPNRFGSTRGNAPNVQAIAFGEKVFTDGDGFRVPDPAYVYPDRSVRSVLILGDSVPFGVGVPEDATFVGRLRIRNTDWTFYNAAVSGYYYGDYMPVLEATLALHPEISAVVLVFTLNDIANFSARKLDAAATHHDMPPAGEPHWVDRMRRIRFVEWANEHLRERSKLYLFIKNHTADPSRRYFLGDLRTYQDDRMVRSAVTAVAEIAAKLKRANVPLAVIVPPYEFQLREARDVRDLDALLPQRLLTRYFAEQGVACVDAMPWFRDDGRESSFAYFLAHDPMHLSRKGHEVMYRGIRDILRAR